MLQALGRRGPDSTGLALYKQPRSGEEICWIKLTEKMTASLAQTCVRERVVEVARVVCWESRGDLVRMIVQRREDVPTFCQAVESVAGCEVVSLGTSLEITKQVGAADGLNTSFQVTTVRGSHGIGHTRLSTESKVDLSHSQPFWAWGVADLSTVHNGHITNYDRLRRVYEQRGYRFFTHNDSEVIGVYLVDQLSRGRSLEEAIESSLDDLDGSFTYLVATPDMLAYARDPFAFKPLVVVEMDDYVVVANEEVAIRSALPDVNVAREPGGHVCRVWRRTPAAVPVAALA
jgi:glutamate synthase domain-containing protein 1